MLKSLIFDFDGLILDTETPDFRAWQAIFREYGYELPAEKWGSIIGGRGISSFNAAEHLAGLCGGAVAASELNARQEHESMAMLLAQPVLPGVTGLLQQAREAGLKLAIASSSPHDWVETHLARLGLLERFDPIICAEDVAPGRTKPNPDLYLKALEVMDAAAEQAVVFEDSYNGVKAARAAGIFVVAVPNTVTALLGVDGADMKLKSLEEFDLRGFMARA
ncbi:MAG TPA: HAD-IA family hydrolase [Anaerolineales bacterium]